MKKITKIFSALLIATMTLTACGTKNNDSETGTADKSQDNSLQYIKDNGELILGLDASFPPMGYKDDDGNIVGFDIDLAKEVCKRMGVELKLQPIDWDSKELELKTKNIDCIWNGLSYSTERAASMTLSESYMTNTQVVVLPADSSIASLADLAGKTVAIQSGSTASDAMDVHTEVTDTLKELVKVDNNVTAMLDLKAAGSDAVVMDEVVARYYMEQNEGQFKVLDETLADEQYVIGFRQGDQALCDEITKILKEMAADGTLAEISTTWFGSDITTIK